MPICMKPEHSSRCTTKLCQITLFQGFRRLKVLLLLHVKRLQSNWFVLATGLRAGWAV